MKKSIKPKKIFIKYDMGMMELRFGTRKWSNINSKDPLESEIEGINCKLFIKEEKDEYRLAKFKGINLMPEAFIIMEFSKESNVYKNLNGGLIEKPIAEIIYNVYTKFMLKTEYLFHTKGKMEYCDFHISTFKEFYSQEGGLSSISKLRRTHDNINFKDVKLIEEEVIKGKNPKYMRKNLLDLKKRKMMQQSMNSISFDDNVRELLKLKTDIILYGSWFSIVESCSLLEIFFIEYATNIFQKIGLSKSKIKEIKSSEISFSKLINIYIPLTLTPREYSKNKIHLDNLNLLRRLRNEIVHTKLRMLDRNIAIKGIDAGISIYQLLKKK